MKNSVTSKISVGIWSGNLAQYFGTKKLVLYLKYFQPINYQLRLATVAMAVQHKVTIPTYQKAWKHTPEKTYVTYIYTYIYISLQKSNFVCICKFKVIYHVTNHYVLTTNLEIVYPSSSYFSHRRKLLCRFLL